MSKLETLKKSIKTICHQFPPLIEKYPLEDQQLIYEFLELVKHFEEADNQREKLRTQFITYTNKIRKSDRFLETYFLGLTVILAENALYHLSIARFYPHEFYGFLLQQLRPLFHLIRSEEPLKSKYFEKALQHIKILYSALTSEELRLLDLTYAILEIGELESLNSNFIKMELMNKEGLSSRLKKRSELSRFYTLIEGRWWIHFHSRAFGLTHVFFHITSKRPLSLEGVFNLNEPKNTTLCYSSIFQVQGSEKEYFGLLLVPNKNVDLVEAFFQQYEDQTVLTLHELQPIQNRWRSTSFKYYKENIGWVEPSQSKKNQLKRLLRVSESEVDNYDPISLHFTPYTRQSQDFLKDNKFLKSIELYIKSPSEFSYDELPYSVKTNKRHLEAFSRDEIELLQEFYAKKVLSIGFIPWRLIDDYSINMFFIKIPNISMLQLKLFLDILPYAEVYFSVEAYYIWTVLTPKMFDWIKSSLNWLVTPVSRIHVRQSLKEEWFDKNRYHWDMPILLQPFCDE